MKFIVTLAQVIGFAVMAMWVLGATTPMNFRISFTTQHQAGDHDQNTYSCDAGDSFWTRRKYLCNHDEWEAQQKTVKE